MRSGWPYWRLSSKNLINHNFNHSIPTGTPSSVGLYGDRIDFIFRPIYFNITHMYPGMTFQGVSGN